MIDVQCMYHQLIPASFLEYLKQSSVRCLTSDRCTEKALGDSFPCSPKSGAQQAKTTYIQHNPVLISYCAVYLVSEMLLVEFEFCRTFAIELMAKVA